MTTPTRHPLAPLLLALPLLLASLSPAALAQETIDWTRARDLHRKELRGIPLSADDQTYLDRAKAARQQTGAATQPQPKSTTGLIPLTDLPPTASYKGQPGGLYPGGQNQPPEPLLRLALAAAKNITPRDPKGTPDPAGKIVLLSIGMSNTTQEFSAFQQLANRDPAKNPNLLIVDAAQGGQDAAAWTNGDPAHNPVWKEALARITRAGATPQQVQAVWIKQALAQPARYGNFPDSANELQKDLATTVTTAKAAFPNLQLAYLSSRTFGGYATGTLNPEPFAYEGAFAVRNLIADQLRGNPALNPDPAKGPATAPLLLWGPYLWADGTTPRPADALTWSRTDFGPDGTHPNAAGRQKVASLLLAFFKSNPTTSPWFLKP